MEKIVNKNYIRLEENIMKRLLSEVNDHQLWMDEEFYFIIYPNGDLMVNTSGKKEEVIEELKRWRKEIDSKNRYMLKVENTFIFVLENQQIKL